MDTTSSGQTLNLVLTYTCNFRCRHCIADCGPERRETMDGAEAADFIDGFVTAGNVSTLGYTGGEPLLVPGLLKDLMAHVHARYGLPQGLVSNCFWATSEAVAAKRLEELYDLGLRILTVSCDTFHTDYGDLANIRRAIHAAMALGIQVSVNTVVTRRGRISIRELPELLDLPEDGPRPNFREFGPIRVGRAARAIDDEDFIETDDRRVYNGRCNFVIDTPSIAPSGDLFACCCFGDAGKDPQSRIGYVGNLRHVPAGELIQDMRRNLLFNLLASQGPLSILSALEARKPGLAVRGRYFTTCDLCVDLFLNPPVRAALADMLTELAAAGGA